MMSIKKKVFLVTALLYIFYTVFPLFGDVFRIPVWLPSIAAFAVMIALFPPAFANKTVYWFLIYAFVLVLFLLVHLPLTIGIGTVADKKKILIEFAYILPTLSIFSIVCYLKDYEVTRRLITWSVVMLFASFIIAVPLMLRYNSLRAALSEVGEDLSVPGLPGYSLMHAYTLFLPVLCYAAKINKGWGKWLSIIGLLGLCFVIYDTFVTTSLIIMVAIVFFTIVYSSKNPSLFVGIFLLLIMFVLLLYYVGFFVALIDWVMPAFEGTAVENKLIGLKSSMVQGQAAGGFMTTRQHLHSISWNSFFQNPLFGTSVVGGHSSLVDRLGGMGLLGGLPFIMIIVSFVRRVVKLYKTKLAKAFFWVGIISGLVFLYMKGLWGCESWLMYMVLMPMGILVFENKHFDVKIS